MADQHNKSNEAEDMDVTDQSIADVSMDTLRDIQRDKEADIDLLLPRLLNSSRKLCHFNTVIRLIMHHWNESPNGCPPAPIQEDRFASELIQFKNTYASSTVVADAADLFKTFCQCYYPHKDLQDLIRNEQDIDWMFRGLLGNPIANATIPIVIPRSEFFSFIQPRIRRTTIPHDSSQFHPPPTIGYEHQITIELPENFPPTTTLSGLIEEFFRDGHVDNLYTIKSELMNGCDALLVFIYWTPPAGTVAVASGSGTAPPRPRRPRFRLGGDLLIPTVEDGPVLYRLTGGCLHEGMFACIEFYAQTDRRKLLN